MRSEQEWVDGNGGPTDWILFEERLCVLVLGKDLVFYHKRRYCTRLSRFNMFSGMRTMVHTLYVQKVGLLCPLTNLFRTEQRTSHKEIVDRPYYTIQTLALKWRL